MKKVDQLLSRCNDVISVFLSKLCSIRNYFFSDGKKSKCKWILNYHQSGDGTYKEKLRFGILYLRENTVSQNYRMDCLPLISLRFARIFKWFSIIDRLPVLPPPPSPVYKEQDCTPKGRFCDGSILNFRQIWRVDS